MIGCILKIAPEHHGGVIQQRPAGFLHLIHLDQKTIEMSQDVGLDPTQWMNQALLTPMVGEGVPTSGSPGNANRSINPIQREGDDASGIGLQGQPHQIEEIAHLGGKGMVRILNQLVVDARLACLQPECLATQSVFQLLHDPDVGLTLSTQASLLAPLIQFLFQPFQDGLIFFHLLASGAQVFLAEEALENSRLIMHGGNG